MKVYTYGPFEKIANVFQVYLTQVYSPDGSASHISAFLIPQYALSEFQLDC